MDAPVQPDPYEPQDLESVHEVAELVDPDSPRGLIDEVINAAYARDNHREQGRVASGPGRLDRFLNASVVGDAIRAWLGDHRGVLAEMPAKEDLLRRLTQDVARLDELINRQVNAVIHHPRFQRLEATWRGLDHLVSCGNAHGDPNIRIRVLNASWKDLERDFEKADDYDRSHLFRQVHDQEYGMPGGQPFGVLLGDYEIHPRITPDHPHDDLGVLKSIAQVAAAAFCPFIASAAPAMFGLDDYQGLERRLNLTRTFDQLDYLIWRELRSRPDSRFLGLTVPRVLMRRPYQDDGSRVDGFHFHENASNGRNHYLWGSPVWALGGVLIRAFAQSGWLADIHGVERGSARGGLSTELAQDWFATDQPAVAPKFSTDIGITDDLERELSEHGFLSLCPCPDTSLAAFYSTPSVQKAAAFTKDEATQNARISAQLQYVFCVSRFAHYLKVMARDRVGLFNSAEEMERHLQDWIVQYVTADSDASPAVKARHPLREAKVEVKAEPRSPGAFQCRIYLMPHFQFENMIASVDLTTTIAPSVG